MVEQLALTDICHIALPVYTTVPYILLLALRCFDLRWLHTTNSNIITIKLCEWHQLHKFVFYPVSYISMHETLKCTNINFSRGPFSLIFHAHTDVVLRCHLHLSLPCICFCVIRRRCRLWLTGRLRPIMALYTVLSILRLWCHTLLSLSAYNHCNTNWQCSSHRHNNQGENRSTNSNCCNIYKKKYIINRGRG